MRLSGMLRVCNNENYLGTPGMKSFAEASRAAVGWRDPMTDEERETSGFPMQKHLAPQGLSVLHSRKFVLLVFLKSPSVGMTVHYLVYVPGTEKRAAFLPSTTLLLSLLYFLPFLCFHDLIPFLLTCFISFFLSRFSHCALFIPPPLPLLRFLPLFFAR